jgi:NADH pyrophosphatase NudC (nudix superfamily)
MKWRKICSFRWESELTLNGAYAVDSQFGCFTVLRLKPRASTKESMHWESVGGTWSLPDAKRMAARALSRAERAAARACPKCGSEKTHRCKTGQCLHCDICEHLWFPGQPDCTSASQAKFNESRS